MVPRSLVVSLALSACLLPAQASTLEEASGHFIAYQFDGGSHHDAPDTCEAASAEWSAPTLGSTDGILVAPDDVADVFVIDVPSSLKGKRLHIDLVEPGDAGSLDLTAYAPGCTGTVFDAVNWPTPEPTPPEPTAGRARQSADVQPLHCDQGQWLFTIDQVPGPAAPDSIHLAWTDGTQGPVERTGQSGSVAIYRTTANLDILLKGAWANLPIGWQGTFSLAVGPCDGSDGGAVYGSPPAAGVGFLDFTPVKAGPHVLQVTYRKEGNLGFMPIPAPISYDPSWIMPVETEEFVHAVEHDPAGTLGAFVEDLGDSPPPEPAMPGPIVIPASCHGCVDQAKTVVETLSYRLVSSLLGPSKAE
jgi:hypothetical protein